MSKDKIRKIAVIAFIGLGLVLGIYEMKKPGPTTVTGSGTGYNDELSVELLVKEKGDSFKIIGVNVIHEDTPPIAGPAIEKLKEQILLKQNSELDIVAGATYTSEGVIEATEEAISNITKVK
ncbi:MAG: FMN-binding protein [Cetobacterium sp.]